MRHRALLVVLAWLVPLPLSAQSESVEYYGTDAVGSVRVVFDAAGNLVTRMDYGPFGAELSSVAGLPPQRFAGLERDGEAGLDYAQARMYQPRTGRFNAPDPMYAGLFDPQQWNRYAYAYNNPISFTDPSGLCVPGDCRPENTLNFLFLYFTFGAFPPTYGELPPEKHKILLGLGRQEPPKSEPEPKPEPKPKPPEPPKPPPGPPKEPRPPGGYPSCRSFRVAGNAGEIAVQSAFPGHVSWGVTMTDRMIGTLFVFEQYTLANGRPGSNISRPYFYGGTGGTTHGSRSGLRSGSEYHLQAMALYPPMRASGAVGCIVP